MIVLWGDPVMICVASRVWGITGFHSSCLIHLSWWLSDRVVPCKAIRAEDILRLCQFFSLTMQQHWEELLEDMPGTMEGLGCESRLFDWGSSFQSLDNVRLSPYPGSGEWEWFKVSPKIDANDSELAAYDGVVLQVIEFKHQGQTLNLHQFEVGRIATNELKVGHLTGAVLHSSQRWGCSASYLDTRTVAVPVLTAVFKRTSHWKVQCHKDKYSTGKRWQDR